MKKRLNRVSVKAIITTGTLGYTMLIISTPAESRKVSPPPPHATIAGKCDSFYRRDAGYVIPSRMFIFARSAILFLKQPLFLLDSLKDFSESLLMGFYLD